MIPELPDPPSPWFKLGELDDVDPLAAATLLVMTREMVLLPLTVTMVVMTGTASVVASAVTVDKAMLLAGSVGSAAVVGASLVGAAVGEVGVSSSVVGSGAVEVGSAVELGA